MINKKFMLIAILLVSLLAVSAVSANEINSTEDIVSEEIAVDDNLEVTQEDTISTTHKVTGNTFEDIQNVVDIANDGDTIELSGNYAGSGTPISISKSITIDGKGQTTLDANKLSRILVVNDVKILKNINFVNGDASGDEGGAISLNGNCVEIEGCTFRNNVARLGGAISAYGSGVNISDCDFINDRAFSEVTVDSNGNKNAYTADGGAIYIGRTNDYYLNNCNFINCSAQDVTLNTGGAICSRAENLHITDCDFIDGIGGAIQSSGIYAKITDCNFTNNKIINKKEWANGEPIVYLSGYDSIMSNCNFINNTCDRMLAFRCDGGSLSNCNFRDNELYINVIEVNNHESFINKCNFINNKYLEDYDLDGYPTSTIFISPFIFSSTSEYNNLFINDIVTESDSKNMYSGAVTVEDNILTIINSASAKGHITVNISDKTFTESVNAGRTQFDLSSIKSGTYLANIYYSGDDYNYEPSEMNILISVKTSIELKSEDVSKYFGGTEKFTVKLTKDGKALSNADVKISIDGKTSTVATDSNGQASLSLNLPVGTYDVVSTYDGASATSKVTVKSTLTASDVSGTYMNSKVSTTFLNIDGKALTSKQATFKVGDKTYAATTNSKGVATADIDLGVGSYTVTAINPVNNEQKQFKLVIDKANSAIALASNQNNGVTTLTATLTPATATGNVVFNVNGEDKSATIKNGKATLTLSDLEPGDYAVTASYAGDKNLKASASSAVTFNVADVYPILTANPVTKTYGTSTKLVVNLVDSKGNAIANADVNVDINGQVTPITTDSNGQATMSINKAPGTYSATITYADAQTTAKITVKKATPKLTAKAKTFKKSVKTKKYTVTLKNNKNKALSKVKLSLKVKGKTYYATTNKYGKATFKITKLTKKGKYTAIIKFKGSKYYNAKTVKPKITVK